ncbi:actin-related protein 8-like [Babylonia areolata]|uniref:actin-related protein 8-like n=1 Tax=Babylonia areolata TaxID=304850 RepID=UPI003FD616B4
MPQPASKKSLFQTADEPVTVEPIQQATVIVIQPGSYNLRLGRASDAYPVTVPHCIARRITGPNTQQVPSDWLLREECMHAESNQQVKEGIQAVEELLLSRPTHTGEYRQLVPVKQLVVHNSKATVEKSERICSQKWTNMDSHPPFVVGEEALYINPKDGYQLSWPIKRGRLNLHSKAGGSMTAVLADLESIWSSVIYSQLQIPTKDLKHYRAILLIPDVYNQKHVKAMFELLLFNMGFEAVIVHQESVCATFGAGLPNACVVDVGDQKTSVCCVDDGMSQHATRITMEYGGSDITRCLYNLLKRSGAHLPEMKLSDAVGILQLQEIKEAFCHMDQDRLGIRPHVIQIKLPQQNIMKYGLRLGDEMIVAALSIFKPEAFGLQGSHLTRTQLRGESDPEDPHDHDYLRRTARQSGGGRLKKDAANANREADTSLGNLDDLPPAAMEDDSNDIPDSLTNAESGAKTSRKEEEEEEEEIMEEEGDTSILQLMGIDQAILHSIDKCDGEEMKRRMYSTILLVGGGLSMEGAHTWLQYQVWMNMPPHYRSSLETMDVITRPKDMEPSVVSWKGASILACLDSCQELWIHQQEYRQASVRLLRERSPFDW